MVKLYSTLKPLNIQDKMKEKDFTATIRVVERKTKKIVEITLFFKDEVVLKVWENFSLKMTGSFYNKSFFEKYSLLDREETLRYEFTLVNGQELLFELSIRTEPFSKYPQEFVHDKISLIHS